MGVSQLLLPPQLLRYALMGSSHPKIISICCQKLAFAHINFIIQLIKPLSFMPFKPEVLKQMHAKLFLMKSQSKVRLEDYALNFQDLKEQRQNVEAVGTANPLNRVIIEKEKDRTRKGSFHTPRSIYLKPLKSQRTHTQLASHKSRPLSQQGFSASRTNQHLQYRLVNLPPAKVRNRRGRKRQLKQTAVFQKRLHSAQLSQNPQLQCLAPSQKELSLPRTVKKIEKQQLKSFQSPGKEQKSRFLTEASTVPVNSKISHRYAQQIKTVCNFDLFSGDSDWKEQQRQTSVLVNQIVEEEINGGKLSVLKSIGLMKRQSKLLSLTEANRYQLKMKKIKSILN